MRLVIGTPSVEPVTVEEVKAHLRVTNNDEDEYIESLIPVAREWCETFQGRSWITRSIDFFIDAWPQSPLMLPRPPIQEIISITYTTDSGQYTVPEEAYVLNPMGELCINGYMPNETVQFTKVTYKAGYGNDPSSVPNRNKQAMLLMISHWFENREITSGTTVNSIPYTAEALLNQERIITA